MFESFNNNYTNGIFEDKHLEKENHDNNHISCSSSSSSSTSSCPSDLAELETELRELHPKKQGAFDRKGNILLVLNDDSQSEQLKRLGETLERFDGYTDRTWHKNQCKNNGRNMSTATNVIDSFWKSCGQMEELGCAIVTIAGLVSSDGKILNKNPRVKAANDIDIQKVVKDAGTADNLDKTLKIIIIDKVVWDSKDESEPKFVDQLDLKDNVFLAYSFGAPDESSNNNNDGAFLDAWSQVLGRKSLTNRHHLVSLFYEVAKIAKKTNGVFAGCVYNCIEGDFFFPMRPRKKIIKGGRGAGEAIKTVAMVCLLGLTMAHLLEWFLKL